MMMMMFSRYILVASAFLPDIALATMNQFISAELVWPKPQARYNSSIDNVTIAPKEQRGPYSAYFPCYYVPVPEDVERIPWPIQGGQIQINYTSELWSSDDEIDNDSMGWWGVEEVFGQFRGLNKGSETVMTRMEDHFLPSYPSANATWKLGTSCLDRMAPLDHVQEDLRLRLETGLDGMAPRHNVTVEEMEGVEATLAVSFAYHVARHLVSEANGWEWTGDVFAECIYVKFTSDPVEGPQCRPEDTELSPSPTLPTTPEPTLPRGTDEDDRGAGGDPPTDDNAGGSDAQNSQVNSTVIGVAAGVSSAIAIAIIVLAFWLYRRRRARRALAASTLATAERGLGKTEKKTQDGKKVGSVEKKDKKVAVDCDLIMVQEAIVEADRSEMVRKGKKVDDCSEDASSSYSEPLPKYEEKPKE